MHAKLLQLCLILCDPMDYSPPGFSVHEIFQARILDWVAISSSKISAYFSINTLAFMSLAPTFHFFSCLQEAIDKKKNQGILNEKEKCQVDLKHKAVERMWFLKMLFSNWAPASQEQHDQWKEDRLVDGGGQVDLEWGPREMQSRGRWHKGKDTCRNVGRQNQIPTLWSAPTSAPVVSLVGAVTASLQHGGSAFVPKRNWMWFFK